jgi:hypothetical protein
METKTVAKKQTYKVHKYESADVRIFVEDVYKIVEGGSLLNEQLRLAQKYKNGLIAIELDRLNRVREAMHRLVPDYARASDVYEEVEFAVKTMRDGFKIKSQHARKKYKPTEEERAELGRLLKRRAEAKKERNQFRSEAYKDGHTEFAATKEAIDTESKVSAKSLYAVARSEWGLYWSTMLVIDRSVQQIKGMARKHHKNPQFRRWFSGKFLRRLVESLHPESPVSVQDDKWREFADAVRPVDRAPETEIAVQIQATKPLTWAGALLCRDTRLRIERQPGSKRVVVWLTVGSLGPRKPVWVKVLCNLHREPPPDTEIKWVRLFHKHAGPDSAWELHFTLERPSWPREGLAVEGKVGVDINWRRLPKGLRVAVAVGSDERRYDLIIPEYLRPEDSRASSLIVREVAGSNGQHFECICPVPLITRMQKSQDIRSTRDLQFDAALDAVAGWLKRRASIVPEWLARMTVGLGQSNSTQRFRMLYWAWNDRRFAGDEEIIPLFGHWEERDRHLHRYEWGNRQKALRIRDDTYQKFAWLLAHRYAEVRLENCDWKSLIKIPPPEINDKAWTRLYAPIAAPGTLAVILGGQWDKETKTLKGSKFREAIRVPAEYTTLRCHQCGHIEDFDAGKNLTHGCSQCSCAWDIDVNAAINIRDAEVLDEVEDAEEVV